MSILRFELNYAFGNTIYIAKENMHTMSHLSIVNVNFNKVKEKAITMLRITWRYFAFANAVTPLPATGNFGCLAKHLP